MSHEHAVTLLAAYADDELPPETRREVEAHLAECGRCVQELRVQAALSLRLREEESALEPSDTLRRLEAYVAELGRSASAQGTSAVDIGSQKRPVLRHPLLGWSGWLVAASLAAVWALGSRGPSGQGMAGMSMGKAAISDRIASTMIGMLAPFVASHACWMVSGLPTAVAGRSGARR